MKAVLISIKPQWCGKIASGAKTIEVRKNRPELKPPFRCYIYCSMPKTKDPHQVLEIHGFDGKIRKANGKVIGEFICDKITMNIPGYIDHVANYWGLLDGSCLTADELMTYGNWNFLYGWNISNLKIYDEPKELSAFCFPPERFCEPGLCGNCPKYEMPDEYGDVMFDCEWKRPIMHPPKSWCYVDAVYKIPPGQGTNARSITDFCPNCGKKMTEMPMCASCVYGNGKWKDDGICFACMEQVWIPGKPHRQAGNEK